LAENTCAPLNENHAKILTCLRRVSAAESKYRKGIKNCAILYIMHYVCMIKSSQSNKSRLPKNGSAEMLFSLTQHKGVHFNKSKCSKHHGPVK